MKLFLYTSLMLLASFIVLAPNAAEATTVQNDVSVRSSTGGNSSGGEIVEGEAQVSVFIETTVDGEVVQRVEEEKTGVQGEPVEIKEQVEYKNDAAGVETEASVEIQEGSDSATVKHEVEQNQEEQENKEENPLIASIVGFFRKIFSWFLA